MTVNHLQMPSEGMTCFLTYEKTVGMQRVVIQKLTSTNVEVSFYIEEDAT